MLLISDCHCLVRSLCCHSLTAAALCARQVFYCREVAQSTATALYFDDTLTKESRGEARKAAAKICQYLAAWAWELNAKLTGPTSIRASSLYSDDVINVQPAASLSVLPASMLLSVSCSFPRCRGSSLPLQVLLPEAEAKWLSTVRSRPLQLIGMCR